MNTAKKLRSDIIEMLPQVDAIRTLESIHHQLEVAQFEEHYKQWKAETVFESNGRKILENTHYQKIINMGKVAVPLILEKYVQANDHWSYALRSITGISLNESTNYGNLEAIRMDWIEWGVKKKLIDAPEFSK
mgnify:CR=1 FL=1